MTASPEDRTLVRRRHAVRVYLLKRRVTAASVLGFAALFGLAAQHVVRAASAGNAVGAPSSSARVSANVTPTKFFDQKSDGFSFDNGVQFSQSALPAAPAAQTSVS